MIYNVARGDSGFLRQVKELNKLKIRKLGIVSVAKIYAVMAFVLSLLISIPYGLFVIVIALIGGVSAGAQDSMAGLAFGGGGLIFGLLIMIGIPIVYASFGFIGGALCALIYNILAGTVGGIVIEVENVY